MEVQAHEGHAAGADEGARGDEGPTADSLDEAAAGQGAAELDQADQQGDVAARHQAGRALEDQLGVRVHGRHARELLGCV